MLNPSDLLEILIIGVGALGIGLAASSALHPIILRVARAFERLTK